VLEDISKNVEDKDKQLAHAYKVAPNRGLEHAKYDTRCILAEDGKGSNVKTHELCSSSTGN
jgi:hypothetical protein